MKVLGIHDGHNASICLLEDGEIKFAIQEERLVNEKNRSGFPKESIKYMFSLFNLKPSDIDQVAMASKHSSQTFATGEFFKKYKKSNFRQYFENLGMKTPLYTLYKEKRRKQRLQNLIKIGFGSKKIVFVDHHLCHAATAYFGSNFSRKEKILVLTNDGAGDGLCATVSIGHYNNLIRIAKIKDDHSLAGIYCLITKMLGFKPLEHEYKLMGMAPYCSPTGMERGHQIFKNLISFSKINPFIFKRNSKKATSLLMPYLQKNSQFVRFDWVCAGLQKFTEDVLVRWVENCLRTTGINKVALAGGIFMNVKANQKILESDLVKDLFVFPSCGDDTISLGAAYIIYNKFVKKGVKEIKPLEHFYLADDFSNEDALKEIKKAQKNFDFKYKLIKNIEKEIATLLAKKKVVARCKGEMEFGARALGNRSILADPSNLSCLREINMMIKNRDFWMPFAPVILNERQHDYIVNKKKVEAPYMILTFDTTEKYPEMVAGVHQSDLTARPQVITPEMNSKYYNVLKEFEKKTGRGVLLNTSFNLHGSPIVHGPKEAIQVFKDSGLKYLALGDYLLEKRKINLI